MFSFKIVIRLYIWEVTFYFQHKIQEVPFCGLMDSWMGKLLSLLNIISINDFLVFDTILRYKCSYNMNALFSVDIFYSLYARM